VAKGTAEEASSIDGIAAIEDSAVKVLAKQKERAEATNRQRVAKKRDLEKPNVIQYYIILHCISNS
jgi:F0F1-type ATP synthase epsilon subunit